jgi:FkbM family methyltransferase
MIKYIKKIIPEKLKKYIKYHFPENIFLKNSKGVIHIGASFGQERDLYNYFNQNVIWIEPIFDVFCELKKNISTYKKQFCFNYLITDKNDQDYKFKVTNNSLSSSIFDLSEHKKVWPEVKYTHFINLKSINLKTFFLKENIDLKNYNSLIIDTQGSELLVLKGLGEFINFFKYAKVEACSFQSYEGGCTDVEIVSYMEDYNFFEKKRFTSSTKIEKKNYLSHDILFEKIN